MIAGGNATVFVSNMDNAVRFYTDVLGLRLVERYGDHWARVDAGKGFTIGLHPASPKYPAPGTKGSITLGLEVTVPLAPLVQQLKSKGVRFTGAVVQDEGGFFASFEDPDGTPMYLRQHPESQPQ